MFTPLSPTGALSRRRMLLGLGALAAGAAVPAAAAPLARDPWRDKRLIVLTLAGGNDGYNTLVPAGDPLYRRLRPTLALPSDKVLPISDGLALHPALVSTMALYQSGELAIVQDVGYPKPSLSHFESSAIWESADPLHGPAAESGWWGEVVMRNRAAFEAADFDAAAVSFEGAAAFAAGRSVPVLRARQDVAELFANSGPRLAPSAIQTSDEGRMLAEMIAEGSQVQARFARRLRHVPRPSWRPYERPIDVQVQLTDWFLGHGVTTPLVRLTLDGFDTHSELLTRHGALMGVLDGALADLRSRLRATGLWDDTVVLVQSEFGRRPGENGFGGTDHGTAAPVLLLGGRVQGGLYGARVGLEKLDQDGNTGFGTDFRRVYASLVSGLFGLAADPFAGAGFAPLPIRLT